MKKHTVIGVDLAKQSFALVELKPNGQDGWRKTLRRSQVLRFLARQPCCTVALEACAGAHYWGRQIQAFGHEVQILPPQHVKACLRGQKNDYNDAWAIAETCHNGRVRTVRVKTVEQQDQQLLIQQRRQLIGEQVRLGNQIRALLMEYGLVLAKGKASLARIPELLEDGENELGPLSRQILQRQYRRWRALREELAWYDRELKTQAKADDTCCRLSELPGFGPIVSQVFKGWIGDGKQLKRGRDASAALGLVPRQHSTGGRHVLLGISKRGDRYVRATVIHGARSVVQRATRKEDALSRWINRLVQTRGYNKAVVALANKLVRMAWVIVARGERYRPAVV
ncbi:IS110 family transposase [Marinobacter sp. NFXS9]|uniref:IS110 family transposase n=1 Tax=Marinobacter sp. NFXS9 TaxID=2818433 RepID=UPI0032DECFD2